MIIRPTVAADVPFVQDIVEEAGLFPREMVPDLLAGFLADPAGSGQQWLSCEIDGSVAGFCYAVEEMLAEGTWNMLAIGVGAETQSRGIGARIVGVLEDNIGQLGGRIVIVDTSGTEPFARARDFYRQNGYVQEATIRDFWGPGDDKVVFWKSLVTL